MLRMLPHPQRPIDLCRSKTTPTLSSSLLQVYNGTVPSVPALDASKYQSCWGMQLDGYVNVTNNTDLNWLSSQTDPSFYNRYRICVRYNGQVGRLRASCCAPTSQSNGGVIKISLFRKQNKKEYNLSEFI